MASPTLPEHLKGPPDPLQRHDTPTQPLINGYSPSLPEQFVTPPRRTLANAGAALYSPRISTPSSVAPSAPTLKAASVGASSVPVPVMQGIRVLIEEKEKELTSLSERRVQGVEAQAKSLAEDLRKKESEAATLHRQLSQLTSDFKYNLKLLEERDAELEKQDQELAAFRRTTAELERRVNEAQREAGEWREEAERMRHRVGEVESALEAYQEVVQKVGKQLEDTKRLRDEEVAKQAAETGVLKAHLAELNAQHEADVEAAIHRTEESFQTEKAAAEKRVSEVRRQLEDAEEKRRQEVQSLRAEMEAMRHKGNERVADEREKSRREVQNAQQKVDEMSVKQQKMEEEHRAEMELLEKKLGAEYQAALLRLQEEHGADVSARTRAHERERELAERRRVGEAGAWAEERLTLAARLEAAEREVRSAGVKWEERVRALQEERQRSEQHAQALQARVSELEGVTSSLSADLENAQKQSRMLQTLVDDLHAALQAKEDVARGLQKRLDELEGANAAALATVERDRAEAEASLRQQLLGVYEAKVGELLDALRTMKEHVASETDASDRKLAEQVEAHETEVARREKLATERREKAEELGKECGELKVELEREKDDAQFVRSTLAARDAEVELLRGEVETIQREVGKMGEERTVSKREAKARTEEISSLRVELAARTAEIAHLAEMLESARAQIDAQGLGAAAGRRAPDAGSGGLGADGVALVRKLAEENEDLRRRLVTAEAGVSNPVPNSRPNPLWNQGPNPTSNVGGPADEREADGRLQTTTFVRPNERGEVRTVSGFASGPESMRTGEVVLRDGQEGQRGFDERGFENSLPSGRHSDASPSSSPAIIKLQEEMWALRNALEALRSDHVAAPGVATQDGRHVLGDEMGDPSKGAVSRSLSSDEGRDRGAISPSAQLTALRDEILSLQRDVAAAKEARDSSRRQQRQRETEDPGLLAVINEIAKLKAVVRGLVGSETVHLQNQGEAPKSSVQGAGRGTKRVGAAGAREESVILGVLQEMKESVALLKADLDGLQRAESRASAKEQVDAPFSAAAGGVRSRVSLSRLSEPAEGFAGGFGSPIALAATDWAPRVQPIEERQKVTSAGTAADVAALQESVAQLTRELLTLRSAAEPVLSGSGSDFIRAERPPVISEAKDMTGGGRQVLSHEVVITRGEAAESGERAGSRWKRTDGKELESIAPSALLQREIAEVRAELAALRSGRPERNEPERNGTVGSQADGSRKGRSELQWADENRTELGVKQTGTLVSRETMERKELGTDSHGQAIGSSRAPLLTWTDLAACLEQSGNTPGSGRVASNKGATVGAKGNGPDLERLSLEETVMYKSANGKPFYAGNGGKWGPSSGTVPARTAKTAVRTAPRTGFKTSGLERKEKQNKVGYAPKAAWATPGSVFQVVKR